MQYYKNSELAELCAVSKRTIGVWIKAAQEGKLPIQLHQVDGRYYIANTSKNLATLKQLTEKGKKYKNTRGQKTASPRPEFYQLYDRKQLFDIIQNLDIHREIPRQYNYFSGGATHWDSYASRLWDEETPNILNSTIELLHSNLGNIDRLIGDRRRVNIIDIGPGNCLPVKELLTHLVYETDVLARYIAIDISEEMLEIARRNIKQWFGDRVAFEGYVRDITYERFNDLVVEETLRDDANESMNLVLFLGGTPANFRSQDDAFKAVCNSMGRNDVLLYSKKLDSEQSRRFFDFNIGNTIQPLPPQYKFLVDLLGLDESLYEVETGFDENLRCRYLRLRLKVATSLVVTFPEGSRTIEFNKGEAILIWRAWHQTAREIIDQFERTGFALLQASTTEDREYLLVAAAVDTPLAIRT